MVTEEKIIKVEQADSSRFESLEDYDIVPKSVLDIINNKADVIKNVRTDINICTTAYSWDDIQAKPLPKE